LSRRLLLYLVAAPLLVAQAQQRDGAGLEAGLVPASWPPSGPNCLEVPDYLVHEYNANLLLVRQSGCLDYEKPFVFLIFGKDRALLLDTGSRNFPAAEMVQNVVGKWLKTNHRSSIELLVVHTHPHSDHVAGDKALQEMRSPNISIKLIPPTVEATKAFYQISSWPQDIGHVDLGERVIDAIPIRGHSPVSIALYDRKTGILFTGDSLYPGRLYVDNWNDFVSSTQRLVNFTKDKLIAHILGNHIEQTRTAYLDYQVRTVYQPDEHCLALARGELLELNDALHSLSTP
jgi:glyoxylase-like metal-dependent hydrolase (beta-lactamase superfamily II)